MKNILAPAVCTLMMLFTASVCPTDAHAAGKAAVVFFSRTGEQHGVGVITRGNTAIVAELIAKKTGADLCEISVAEDHYPAGYDDLVEAAKKEKDRKARPAYKRSQEDLHGYDTVFVGAPVWWYDWPMVMYSFFEQEDLAGKTLIPFSTHAGSGLSGFDRKLAAACPKSTVAEGLAILGSDAQHDRARVADDIDAWLKRLASRGHAF